WAYLADLLPPDRAEATRARMQEELQEGLERGDPLAQFLQGMAATSDADPKNQAAGRDLLRRAATSLPEAREALLVAELRDPATASRAWAALLAEPERYAHALGETYRRGAHGVPRSVERAAFHLVRA